MTTTNRDEQKLYDVRTLERNFRKGLITRKDYDKYLKALPDKADNIAEPGSLVDDDDDDRE